MVGQFIFFLLGHNIAPHLNFPLSFSLLLSVSCLNSLWKRIRCEEPRSTLCFSSFDFRVNVFPPSLAE